jgi:hypothetical protein
MTHSPETIFAFTYSIGTNQHLFDVAAMSQEDARAKVSAMAAAECLGAISPTNACEARRSE